VTAKTKAFRNLAGNHNSDSQCIEELAIAGIPFVRMPECWRETREVPTVIIGELQNWGFRRAWRYWVAEGPGIPPEQATELHELCGTECRVDGHCGCPSPLEWFHGFAVGCYHVDTQEALTALADTIRRIWKWTPT
jgi:hypothetical protein